MPRCGSRRLVATQLLTIALQQEVEVGEDGRAIPIGEALDPETISQGKPHLHCRACGGPVPLTPMPRPGAAPGPAAVP